MHREVITEKQGFALIVLYCIGISSVIVTSIVAQNDLWISIILAILIMIPMGIVYAKLITIIPEKSIFEIVYFCWGRFLGKIMVIFYIWYFTNICIFELMQLREFFRLAVGPETPMTVTMLASMIVAAFAVKKGILVIGRTASFFLIPVLAFIVIDNLFLLPNIEFSNLQPILYNGWGPVIKGVFSAISYPFGELVIFTVIFHSLKDKKQAKKTYLKGIIFAGVILLIVSTITMLTIGPIVADIYYFPAHIAISRVNIGNFIRSVEVLFAFMIIVGGVTNLSILYLCAAKSLSNLFDIDNYKSIIIPLGAFILNFSLLMSKDASEFFRLSVEIWPYYAIPFQLIVPIITLIVATIKVRKKGAS